MRVRENCSAIAVLLFCVLLALQSPSTKAQRTCTETKTGYRAQAFTAYRSEGTSYSTKCGWFGWRRCRGTRYYSVSYTAYRSVAYYYTGCCSGYSGSNCQAVCRYPCQNRGTCSAPNTCTCTSGWTGSTCTTDVDECRSSGRNTCHRNAACANTRGSYTCTCNTGYQGNGFTCQDVNECATNNGGCHHNCHNTVGSYHCSCNNRVLNADGHTCEVPPQKPTNLRSSNIGARSVRLEWQAPPVEFLNSLTRISSYRVTCSQSNFDSAIIVVNTGSDTRWYVLQGTLEEHTQYTCNVRAQNTFGLGNTSQSIQFTTLQAAPSSPPRELSATVESPVSFLLTWSPPPPIDINGIILYYEVVVEEVETGDVSTLSSTVLQQRVDTHPHYHYRCKVAAFTTAKGPYTVNVEVQAPESAPSAPPHNVRAAAINSTSLRLTWLPPPTQDRNGVIRGYSVSLRENGTNGTQAVRLFSVQPGGSTTVAMDVDSLHPYFTYVLSVAANTVALGPYSEPVSIQLPEDAPRTAPTDLQGFTVNSTSISLSWSAIPPEDMNGQIRHYIITLTERNTSAANVYEYMSTAEERVIADLHPYYTYDCKVAAVTIKTGPYSPVITLQTLQDVPSSPPTNFVIQPTPWSLHFSWDPPPPEDRNGLITNYTIQVSRPGIPQREEMNVNGTVQELSVFGLSPHTLYECRIAASTIVGMGPFTANISILTFEHLPTKPQDATVSQAVGLPTQLHITWTEPAKPNGVITSYTVRCAAITGESEGLEPVVVSGNTLDVYVTGLEPYTEYGCFVTANTSAGEGEPSTKDTAVTDESSPGSPPVSVTATSINSTAILLTWLSPDKPNGIVTSYTIVYNITHQENTTVAAGGNVSIYLAADLNEYTVYTFTISASTRVGSGPSAHVTARTDESYPHSPPIDIQLSGIGAQSVIVTWQPPVPQDRNGVIVYYQLIFSQSQFEIFDLVINATGLSYTESSLEEYNNYTVVIAAATRVGLGPFSPPMTFTTLESAPSSPPLRPMASALSSTEIRLSWVPPPPIDVNGELRHYIIELMEIETDRVWSYLAALNTSITVEHLHPHYYYSVQVAAYTTAPGPYTDPFFVQTKESAPTGPPSRPHIVSFSSSVVALSWLPPALEVTNGVIRSYTISVHENETNSDFEISARFTHKIVESLHPFYTYSFKVRAETVGPGPYSAETSRIQLEEAAPSGAPVNVSSTMLSSTGFSLSWSPPPPALRNGEIRHYTVRVTEMETGRAMTFMAANTYIALSALHPAYTYLCTVSAFTVADGPETSPTAVITLEEAPTGPPLDLTATVVSSTTVVLRWEPPSIEDRNGLIAEFILNLTALKDGDTLQLLATTTSLEYGLLKPHTSYSVVIAAVTSVGEGPFSPAAVFTTFEDAPSHAPKNLSAVALDSTTLSLSWSAPPSDHHNGVIRRYHIIVTEVETGRVFQVNSTATSATLLSLHPYFVYICAVSAFTTAEGPYSTNVSIRLPEDIPVSAPVQLIAGNVTADSSVISWQPPPLQDQNGVITGYISNITTVPDGEVVQLVTTTTEVELDFLKPHTSYNVVVAAGTRVGWGPFSSVLLFQSKEAAPSSAPQDVIVIVESSRSIQLSWNPPPPEDHNGAIRGYLINITKLDTGLVHQQTSPVTMATVSSLHPFYTYNCSIAAFTVSTGPFSSEITVTTPQDIPGPPQVTSLTSTSRTIILHWDPPAPEEQNGIILGYNVEMIVASTSELLFFNTSATNFTFHSLSPHSTYEFFVAAYTTAGAGPRSRLTMGRTKEEGPSAGPTNVIIVSVTATTIHLSWEHPPEDTHHGVIRGYRLNITELKTGQEFRSTVMETETVLDSLHPFYTYKITIVAFTVEEGSNYTTVYVETDEAAPSSPPQELIVTATRSSRSIELRWLPPPLDQQNGIIRRYVITISSKNVAPLVLYSTHLNISINNLAPYTTYSCAIAAETVAVGPFTDAVEVRTLEDAPSGPPEDVHLFAINSTTLLITWEPPLEDSRNGVIRKFIVNVTEVHTGVQHILIANGTNVTLADLHPFYIYFGSVAAETVALGPWSEGMIVEMPEDVPSAPPEDLTIANITSSSLLLQWSPPPAEDQNGLIKFYTVTVVEEPTGRLIQLQSLSTERWVHHLHPFYTYTCSVTASTVGVGPFSTTITVTTLESAPSAPPTEVGATVLSSRSILLQWSLVEYENQNGVITGYVIIITDTVTGMVVGRWTSQYTNVTVTALKPYTVYSLSVAAQNAAGLGPNSAPIVAQTLEDAPGAPPFNLTYTNLTSSSLLISWDPPPAEYHNGVLRHYIIEATEEETGSHLNLSSTGTDALISQLHPYYHYSFRVAAVTVSAGPPSQTLTIHMLEDVPSGPPLDVTAEASGSRSILVSWTPPSQHEQNGVVRHYVLDITETDTGRRFQSISNTTSQSVHKLHPYYTYQLRVTAVTVGPGPFSLDTTVTTLQDAPSGPPQDFKVAAVSPYAISLSWLPPLPENQNGIIQLYNITVIELDTGNVTNHWRDASHTQMVISSLHPYYEYQCAIAAATTLTGVFTQPTTVRTLEAAPDGSPNDVLVTTLTSTSIIAEWQPPLVQHRNGKIRHYVLVLVEKTYHTTDTFIVNATDFRLVITSLHASYSYWLEVAAVTVERGPFSEPTPFTMPEDAPSGPPQHLDVSASSSSSLQISWAPPLPEVQNGKIVGYTVTVGVIGPEQLSPQSYFVAGDGELLFNLEGLHPFTNYSITVSASTQVGPGPPTSPQAIQTPEDAPSGPPKNVLVTSVTSRAISIRWQPPPEHQHNGVIRSYVLHIHHVDGAVVLSTDTYDTETLRISVEVRPFRTYNITVAAVTVEEGVRSRIISVTTPEDVPEAAPNNLTVANITSRSLTVLWEPPNTEYWNGIIRHYVVNVTVAESGEEREHTSMSTSLYLNQLHPYYSHQFVISAVTVGPGPFSGAFAVQTLEDAPTAAPSIIRGHPVNSTHILLSWRPPSDEQVNGVLRLYLVKVTELASNVTTVVNSTADQMEIGRLHPYYDYRLSVSAVTISPGPYSTAIVVKTAEGVPSGPPRNVLVTPLSSTSISISWGPPSSEEQNGVIRGYQVKVTSADQVQYRLEFNLDNTSLIATGLRPFSVYLVSVAAVTIRAGVPTRGRSVRTLEDVPSAGPIGITAKALGPSTIEVTWEAPPPRERNGIITAYHITVTEQETGRVTELTTNGTTLFIVVPHLHPYYTYQCSVSAATSIGSGPTGQAGVRTFESVPTAAPLNVTVYPVDEVSAMIRWIPPPPEHHNGLLRGYLVVASELETGTRLQRDTESTSLLLTELHPFSTYQIVIAARTVRLGPFTTSVTIQMPEADPAAPVQDVNIAAISATEVELSWLPPPPQTWNGIILNYTVTYQNLGPVNSNSSADKLTTSLTEALPSAGQPLSNSPDPWFAVLPLQPESLVIYDLEEFHVYSFSVHMANSAGRSDSSNMIIQELPGAEPSGAPTAIQIRLLSSTEVEVLWQPPALLEQNGVITGYLVMVTHAASGTMLEERAEGTGHLLLIEGLQKYTTYTLKIAAMTEHGWGPYSMSIEFTTLEDVPGVPKGIAAQLVNGTSVLVTWLPPSEPNGKITVYEVYYAGYKEYNETESPDDGPHIIPLAGPRELKVVIAKVTIGLTYELKVRAKTKIGYGNFSGGPLLIRIPDSDDKGAEKQSSGEGAIVWSTVAAAVVVSILILVVILALVFVCYKKRTTKSIIMTNNEMLTLSNPCAVGSSTDIKMAEIEDESTPEPPEKVD